MLPNDPRRPAIEAPRVHVVDDYAEYRDGLLYSLRAEGFEARGYASGEVFLAEPLWLRRGVVTLDIDFDPPGSMNGLQIFNLLLSRVELFFRRVAKVGEVGFGRSTCHLMSINLLLILTSQCGQFGVSRGELRLKLLTFAAQVGNSLRKKFDGGG